MTSDEYELLDKPALAKKWKCSVSTVRYAKDYAADKGQPFFVYMAGRYTTMPLAMKFLEENKDFTPSAQRQRRKDRAQTASCK